MKRARRSTLIELLVTAVVLGGLFGTFVIQEWLRWRGVQPPRGSASLVDAVRAVPNPDRIFLARSTAGEYIMVVGEENSGLLSFPSGPPIYVFDGNGALLDWTPDSGDDPDFWREWAADTPSGYPEVEVTLSDLEAAAK